MALEQFGPYQLLEKIDDGGMAEIFLATDEISPNPKHFFILKRMLKKHQESQGVLELFFNEAKVSLCLDHPNLVKVYDSGSIDDRFFIAMELIKGVNVQQLLRKIRRLKLRNLSIPDSLYIVKNAASGLFHAHKAKDLATGKPLKLIHKDVSTDNIMIDINGEVKVIDFGVSSTTGVQRSKAQDGKLPYMSPEQANGKELDERSDIFSLGAILWELLTFRRLYNGLTIDDIKRMAKKPEITDLKDLRPELEQGLLDIVSKSIQPNPNNRYTDMNDFKNSLSDFLKTQNPQYKPKKLIALVKVCFEDENDSLIKILAS